MRYWHFALKQNFNWNFTTSSVVYVTNWFSIFEKPKILRSDIPCERHSFNSMFEFLHSTRIYCIHFAASLHSDRSNSENANGSFDENLNISSEMNQHKQCVLRTWHSLFCTLLQTDKTQAIAQYSQYSRTFSCFKCFWLLGRETLQYVNDGECIENCSEAGDDWLTWSKFHISLHHLFTVIVTNSIRSSSSSSTFLLAVPRSRNRDALFYCLRWAHSPIAIYFRGIRPKITARHTTNVVRKSSSSRTWL